jgi:dihydrofolate reductase
MRNLILKMSVSVDGFVSGPNGEIDWLFPSLDNDATGWIVDTLQEAGLHLMGRRTYHDMAAYWPHSSEPFAVLMNEIPKAVFSKTGSLARADVLTTTFEDSTRERKKKEGGSLPATAIENPGKWDNPLVLGRDLAGDITRLKEQCGKDLLAHGGAGFAQSLVRLGLVDEYRLVVHPVALGKGLPLFAALPKPLHLQRLSTTRFAGGAVANVYRAA